MSGKILRLNSKPWFSLFLASCSLSVFLAACHRENLVYPERKNLVESVYASGKIVAKDELMLQAMNNGTVLKKLVQEGDTVRKGQPMYIISRETQVVTMQSKDKNISDLSSSNLSFKVNSGSSTEDRVTIRSDCDGMIFQTLKEEGEAVHALEPLIVIGNSSDRLIRLAVDQEDVSKIQPGQLVLVRSDITGDTIMEGKVSKIYPLMNEANQTFRVDAVFNHPMQLPFIHNSIEANIVIQKKDHALVLPVYAMTEGDSVAVKLNNRVRKVKI
ncbi:MAG TPA: efflux RND transporter periplasmic adaptor subunit, partial [Saprospiraceae bacterium]|nr:efflux RND transporter periplasmic adaptor subunit [Saprospiraceae bacterium]